MELRDFRNWIIENDFEDNELFQESLICYCNRAYKAAYMFSYLAFIEYIRDSIIEYKGIPIRFEEEWTEKLKNDNCKSETEKKTYIENEWRKKINDLNNEDKWEDTFKSIIGKADYVYCKIKLPKVAKQNWTKLQVQIGHNCKAKYTGSQERCSA